MPLTKLVYVLGTALLFFLSFPPYFTGFLSFICLVPFFQLLEKNEFRYGFRTGYLCGLITIGLLLYWLNFNSGANMVQASAMYVSAILYLALAWGLFGLIQAAICRKAGRIGWIAAPFLWTTIEFLQSLGELGFSWHSLATTQTQYPLLIQFISLTGMYGITFLIVCLNVISLFLLQELKSSTRSRKRVTLMAGMIVVCLGLPFVFGLGRGADPHKSTLTVGIVQPNIEPNQKWLEGDFAFEETMRLTRELPDSLDLIVWPETAIPVRLRYDQAKLSEIRQLVLAKHSSLLTGIPDRRVVRTPKGGVFRSFNSIYYFDRASTGFDTYDKIHLVPFGEFVPSILNWLSSMAMDVGAGNYNPGTEYSLFSLSKPGKMIPFAAVVCLESVYSHFVHKFIEQDARFLIIITNDAWYDGTNGPSQHAQIAVLRAIEFGTSVIRSANSGISCIIDSRGRMVQQAGNQMQATLTGKADYTAEKTLYSRHPYWFVLSVMLSGLGVILFICFGFRRFRASRYSA